MDRTIPELSIDSKMLYDRLIKAEVGAVIPYRELTEVISRDVQGPARGNMNTARHRALRHNGMVFEAVWKVGLKRLNDTEVVAVGEASLGRIRRVARRGRSGRAKAPAAPAGAGEAGQRAEVRRPARGGQGEAQRRRVDPRGLQVDERPRQDEEV